MLHRGLCGLGEVVSALAGCSGWSGAECLGGGSATSLERQPLAAGFERADPEYFESWTGETLMRNKCAVRSKQSAVRVLAMVFLAALGVLRTAYCYTPGHFYYQGKTKEKVIG